MKKIFLNKSLRFWLYYSALGITTLGLVPVALFFTGFIGDTTLFYSAMPLFVVAIILIDAAIFLK